MAQQNWDDHDRSGRYTCRDFGADYLLSLALTLSSLPMVITIPSLSGIIRRWRVGDDDRVWPTLSYLQMGWYVSQMKKDAYKSKKALPLSLQEKDYMLGKLDVAYIADLHGRTGHQHQDAMKAITSPDLQKQIRSVWQVMMLLTMTSSSFLKASLSGGRFGRSCQQFRSKTCRYTQRTGVLQSRFV